MRLDQYLFAQGLVPSRERGRALIMAGLVYVDGEKADKAGSRVSEGALVELRGEDHGYVSRGGLKLEKALDVFAVALDGLVCMDVGASSGGFTDCMLQNGAGRVYAVDVGYGQLAWKLRCDERVVVMERCNIRHLTADRLEDAIEFFTVDVSFISLKLVLPVMRELTAEDCEAVCLVKPQFEAGRDKVGKNGVVRDPAVHGEVLQKALDYAAASGFSVRGLDFSPIRGPKGNIEFLMHVGKAGSPAQEAADVETVVRAAHTFFAASPEGGES